MLFFPIFVYLSEVLIVTIPILFTIAFVTVAILFTVAFVTVAERKTMASMQKRLGPNIVGFYGLLQAFADALKLLLKEYISPTQANLMLFFLGPIITLVFCFIATAFYVLIRLQLKGLGLQDIAYNQLYITILTVKYIVMLFFFYLDYCFINFLFH